MKKLAENFDKLYKALEKSILLDEASIDVNALRQQFGEKNGFDTFGNGWVVLGNTYAIKDQLKAEGARYNGDIRHWILPRDDSKYTTYKISADDLFDKNPKSGVWDYRYTKDPTSVINEISKLEKPSTVNKSEIKNNPNVEVGSRITINIKSANLKTTSEGSYGTYYLYEFIDVDDNQYIWYAHKELDLSEDIKTVTGTVAGFKEYKGVNQVVLSRCKINDAGAFSRQTAAKSSTFNKETTRITKIPDFSNIPILDEAYTVDDLGNLSYSKKHNLAMKKTADPQILAKLADDSSRSIRQSVAENPSTDQQTLAKLADDFDENVRWSVAINSNTDSQTLAKLANDPEKDVRQSVACKSSTDQQILAKLADDSDENVRMCVAFNSNTDLQILTKLADDPGYYVRLRVAINSNTDSQTLAKLANDPEKDVRWSVAGNPNTDQQTLIKLSSDSDYHIRCTVAENPNTNFHIIKELVNDSDEEVSNLAKEVLEKQFPDDMLATKSNKKPDFSNIPILDEAYTVDDIDNLSPAEKCLLADKTTDQQILAKLADDPNINVRWSVAYNPHTNQQTLIKLANDSDENVRLVVAESPNTDQQTLIKLANDSNSIVRWKVAKNPNTDQQTLAKLANDSDVDIRYWVARHSNTDSKILAKLVNDPDKNISAKAKEALEKQFSNSISTTRTNKIPDFSNLPVLDEDYKNN